MEGPFVLFDEKKEELLGVFTFKDEAELIKKNLKRGEVLPWNEGGSFAVAEDVKRVRRNQRRKIKEKQF